MLDPNMLAALGPQGAAPAMPGPAGPPSGMAANAAMNDQLAQQQMIQELVAMAIQGDPEAIAMLQEMGINPTQLGAPSVDIPGTLGAPAGPMGGM